MRENIVTDIILHTNNNRIQRMLTRTKGVTHFIEHEAMRDALFKVPSLCSCPPTISQALNVIGDEEKAPGMDANG